MMQMVIMTGIFKEMYDQFFNATIRTVHCS